MAQQATPEIKGFLGENRLLPDDTLAPNVSPDALNIDYSSGTIKTRPGLSFVEVAGMGGVTGMLLAAPFRYQSSGTWYQYILCAGSGKWFYYYNGSFTDLSQTYTTGNVLFDWCHYKDRTIVAAKNDGVFKFSLNNAVLAVRNLTITPPSTNMAGVDSGAGSGPAAGNYTYVYTFYNHHDDTESQASAVSATVVGAGNAITLSSIDVSTDTQVTKRKIYRLDPNATEYRFVKYVANNTDTTATDDVVDVSTAELLNTDRGALTTNWGYCAEYANRVWVGNTATDPSAVMYSETDKPGDFPATNIIRVAPGDGDEVTGLVSAFGGLLIFKRNSIWFLTGYAATTFDVRLVSATHGALAAHTVAQSDSSVYFMSRNGIYRMSGPGGAQLISLSQSPLIDSPYVTNLHLATATYDARNRRYMVSFHTGVSTKITLVYFEDSDAWAKWDTDIDYLTFSSHLASTVDPTVVAATVNRLCQFSATNDRSGTAISAYWESPWMDFGDPSVVKRLYQAHIWQGEKASTTHTFSYKTDYSESYTDVSFSAADELARFVINTRGRKVKFKFSNATLNKQMDIRGFQTWFTTSRHA